MSLPLDFHPGVKFDLNAAFRWYEERRRGLGIRFLNAVDRITTVIAENPTQFGYAEVNVREGKVKRFPFAVYYQVLSDRIRIVSVFHTSRDPSEWQSRI